MGKMQPKDYGHDYDEANPLDSLAIDLEERLTLAISAKSAKERQMLEALRQYRGEYDETTSANLKDSKRSKEFVNLTRYKTNAGVAQLTDIICPNDEFNFGIAPTPVPELAAELDNPAPARVGQQQYIDQHTGQPLSIGDMAQYSLDQAKEAAEAMEKEIQDQLIEADYIAKERQILRDAGVVGTGIAFGVTIEGRTKRAYLKQVGEDGQSRFTMVQRKEFKPSFEVIRPWDCYPEESASCVEDLDYCFDRLYLTKRQLRAYARNERFLPEQVKRLLQAGAKQTHHSSNYINDIRRLSGEEQTYNDNRFEVWRYVGEVDVAALITAGAIALDDEDDSKLEQDIMNGYQATVYYCGGIVLSMELELLEGQEELPHRFFNWERDEGSLFGFGIPDTCAGSQRTINTAWRLIQDNASITVGSQIAIDKTKIEPENGEWEITPWKVWLAKKNCRDIREAITTLKFDSHLTELGEIYKLAREFMDEESGLPMISQGEQGQVTPTLGGMSMLMNAANADRRRQVKDWDDKITKPLIEAFYDFNMQYNDKENIKGDFNVNAKGTAALLEKETLVNNLSQLAAIIFNNPLFAPVVAPKAGKWVELLLKGAKMPTEDLLPTEQEIADYAERTSQDNQAGEADLKLQLAQFKAGAEQQLEQIKHQHDLEIEKVKFETQAQATASRERLELYRMRQEGQIKQAEFDTKLKEIEMKLNTDMHKFNIELSMKNISSTENYGLE